MLLLYALLLAAPPHPTVSILLPGTYHANEVKAKSGEPWLGLFPTHSGFHWREVPLTIRRVNDPILDGKGQATGIEVSIQNAEPIFLLRGLPHLAKSPVTPAQQSSPEDLSLPNGKRYKLRLSDKKTHLILESGKSKQILYRWPKGLEDEAYDLKWAGDLDGDGQLDLLLNLSDHYNAAGYTLFLSSKRSGAELVHKISEFKTIGC